MTETQPWQLVIGTLAVWRVTHLLHVEDGPGRVLAGLRHLAGRLRLGRLFDCFYCLSLWLALPFAALWRPGLRDGLALWLALSGGAILLERLTQRVASPARYAEDPPE